MSYMSSIQSKNGSQYSPINKEKYKGKYPIQIRSSWEKKMCKWLDLNDQILYWGSENLSIPYFDPVKNKQRQYFPDYVARVIDKKTKIEKNYLIEVKPYKECKRPVITKGKSKKTKLYEQKTWITNQAKWKAAQKYCKKTGMVFKLITERELF